MRTLLIIIGFLATGSAWFAYRENNTTIMIASVLSGAFTLLVFFYQEFIKSKSEDIPLFCFEGPNLLPIEGDFESNDTDFAFRANFDIINNGCNVADLKMIKRSRLTVSMPHVASFRTGDKVSFFLQPDPEKGKYKFEIQYRIDSRIHRTYWLYVAHKKEIIPA